MITVAVFVLVALFGSFNAAQGLELTNFEELINFALKDYGYISAVFDVYQCGETNFEPGTLPPQLAGEYRKWIRYQDNAGTDLFRTTKDFINENGNWIYTKIETSVDGNTVIFVQELSGLTLEILNEYVASQCAFGTAVRFFARGSDMPFDDIDTYEDLKAGLRAGRNLVTRPNITTCGGVDWEGQGSLELFGSTHVDDWEIILEGTEDEVIYMNYHFPVDYFVSSPFGSESIDIYVTPDGAVQMSPNIIDFFTWTNNAPNPNGYQCQLGTSFRLFAPSIEEDLPVYDTYTEVYEGLRSGFEMEIVLEVEQCSWEIPEGETIPNALAGHRSYFWDIQDAGSSELDGYVRFYGLLFTSEAHVIQSQYDVMKNDVVVAQFIDLDVTQLQVKEYVGTCPLGTGAVLRSASRQRNTLNSYSELEETISGGGRVVFEADLGSCEGIANGTGVVIGGSLMQTAASDMGITGYVSELAYDGSSDALFIWGALTVVVQPDDTVFVLIRAYETTTWEDILGGEAVWSCVLGESVTFRV